MLTVDMQLRYENNYCMWNCGKYPESGYFEDWDGDCGDCILSLHLIRNLYLLTFL